jgi:phospholipid-translocating ATPase
LNDSIENLIKKDTAIKNSIHEFFLACSVCHSSFVEEKESGLQYQSSSPDEIALIVGASYANYVFSKRTASSIEVKISSGSIR